MGLLTNIGILYQCRPDGAQADVHPIRDAALAWEGDRITWVGPAADLPAGFDAGERWDAGGRLVVPGLVDCHTHLAFGGWRAEEFVAKLAGASYLDIARAGGGIASTVARTRAASTESLVARCRDHLREMAALGVTTVEAKSGYGLDREHELRLLDVYRTVQAQVPQTIVPTLLAAHTVPPEYRERRERYVDLVVDEIIPAAAARGLARFCDVFVEETAFSPAEGRRVLEAGLAHGLVPKIHADQITDTGGAALAAAVGAASADHLERVDDAGIRAMAAAGVVAVTLPLASLYLHQPPVAARRLIEAGVRVAVATDFNPGSAPSFHLPFAMTLAATLQRMTPSEVLKGVTSVAAAALRLDGTLGSLEVGKRADAAIIDAESIDHWLYHLRANACVGTLIGGRRV
ncbi:MAG: imidazolonepropionase [Gemmatimonadales bacterium]|nr:imidazolonepropionase [Gemmatimonadales bacterium]